MSTDLDATAVPDGTDASLMRRALALGAARRCHTSPNPWVGCVVLCADGRTFEGATEPPGRRHGEIVALDAARADGADLAGATLVVTLEPCNHHGRTPPCVDAIIEAGIARVVCAITDPDHQVAGSGIARLRASGVEVVEGVGAREARALLAPYLHHRRTGRPFVVAKMACTLDGRIAAADGSSRWITGEAARREVHRLRAESDAVIVGAGTVRADDPELTARDGDGPDPRRVVLGVAPADARIHPCLEWQGPLPDLLHRLGSEGVIQVLVEGGARAAASFHRAGLVDRYVIHLAPAVMGGDDGAPVLAGPGASTITDLWRGQIVSHRLLGDDLEIVIEPHPPEDGTA
jgi:diaminohydroxyphosphoribosylaminopyrimidine deaminase / 5-amino-6-(5-phosphoribosylamino)uracil reductase